MQQYYIKKSDALLRYDNTESKNRAEHTRMTGQLVLW